MKKLISLGILGIFVLFGIVYSLNKNLNRGNTKPLIVSTIYPWYDSAFHILGKVAEVGVIVPAGVEPHEYEPSALDTMKAMNAQLFIYNGGVVDAWAEKIAKERTSENKGSFRAMDYINKTNDPHIWIDPISFLTVSKKLGGVLKSIYKEKYSLITSQETIYFNNLILLDQEYKQGLSMCKNNTIAVTHDAFTHLTKRYNLDVVAIVGLSPEEEPSAKRLTEVTQLIKENSISTIFFETLVSPKLADTVAQETGATPMVLNPIEGLTPQEKAKGKTYSSLMQDNLKQLQIALNCTYAR